jgi:hypothetical protein
MSVMPSLGSSNGHPLAAALAVVILKFFRTALIRDLWAEGRGNA